MLLDARFSPLSWPEVYHRKLELRFYSLLKAVSLVFVEEI